MCVIEGFIPPKSSFSQSISRFIFFLLLYSVETQELISLVASRAKGQRAKGKGQRPHRGNRQK